MPEYRIPCDAGCGAALEFNASDDGAAGLLSDALLQSAGWERRMPPGYGVDTLSTIDICPACQTVVEGSS